MEHRWHLDTDGMEHRWHLDTDGIWTQFDVEHELSCTPWQTPAQPHIPKMQGRHVSKHLTHLLPPPRQSWCRLHPQGVSHLPAQPCTTHRCWAKYNLRPQPPLAPPITNLANMLLLLLLLLLLNAPVAWSCPAPAHSFRPAVQPCPASPSFSPLVALVPCRIESPSCSFPHLYSIKRLLRSGFSGSNCPVIPSSNCTVILQ